MTLPGFKDIPDMTARAAENINTILASMRGHLKPNPVVSAKIESSLHLSGPEVRAVVRHLRRQGHLICSGGKGYFYAVDAGEAEETLEHLRARCSSMYGTIQEMEAAITTSKQREMAL